MANPLALPLAGGLAVLLGALALLRLRRNRSKQPPLVDDDESRFESVDGLSVDTSEEGAPSSMMYSPSQLDAGGDVDPVAEADVYLAYGRDKQAEEILKDALRQHPDRLPVYLKLLEIYSQRGDAQAFAATATEVFDITQGTGSEWEDVREMGYALDPNNRLYQPLNSVMPTAPSPLDDAPQAEPATDTSQLVGQVSLDAADAVSEAVPTQAAEDDNSLDFELDLSTPEPASPATLPEQTAAEADPFALDLELDATAAEPAPTAPAPAPAVDEAAGLDFDLDLTSLDATTDAPETDDEAKAEEWARPAMASQELPTEVNELDLDLDAAADSNVSNDQPDLDAISQMEVDEGLDGSDPLETKLSLAREFEAIGDTEGARSLAEEVEAEATGALRERARAFLAQLS